jgi:hypothetical protein
MIFCETNTEHTFSNTDFGGKLLFSQQVRVFNFFPYFSRVLLVVSHFLGVGAGLTGFRRVKRGHVTKPKITREKKLFLSY